MENTKVLKMKLDRYKIDFSFIDNNTKLVIGRSKKAKWIWIFWVVMPFSISLLTFLLLWYGYLPKLRTLSLPIGVFLTLGIIGVAKTVLLNRNNKGVKTFSKEGIRIQHYGESRNIAKQNIKRIECSTISDDSGSIGEVYAISNTGDKIPLLGVHGKERKFVKADLDYLTKILNDVIGTV